MLKLKFWSPDEKSHITGKDPEAGKEWRQEEKGVTQDEMVGWHHRLNGHEFEQTLGDGEGPEARHAVVYGVTKSQIQQSNWTELNRSSMERRRDRRSRVKKRLTLRCALTRTVVIFSLVLKTFCEASIMILTYRREKVQRHYTTCPWSQSWDSTSDLYHSNAHILSTTANDALTSFTPNEQKACFIIKAETYLKQYLLRNL